MDSLVALAVLAMLIACSAMPRRSWTHHEVGNVQVYSGLPMRKTEELVIDLAKFKIAAATLSSAPEVEPRFRADIYLFPDWNSYVECGGSFDASGWANIDALGLLSAMNGTVERELLFHEYTHLILRDGAGLRIPRWVDEGFAEFMSTVRFIDGHVELGRMPSGRAPDIVDMSKWVPLGELFSGAAFSSRDQPRVSRAYASAWFVMHYFQLGRRGEGDDLERYLDLIQQRTDPVVAATAAWQVELHELSAELRTYAKSGPHYVRIPDDVFDFSGISYTSSEMTVPATAEALARLCRRVGNSERARQLTAYGRSMQEHGD